ADVIDWTLAAPCAVGSTHDAACAKEFIQSFGRRAFRRTLLTEETEWLEGVYKDAAAEFDFEESLEILVRVMLQSPQFLYLHEEGEDDPTLPYGIRRLTGYERASRLSYFLWNTMPDEPLLVAAEQGKLDDAEGLRAEADRLLEDPRAKGALHHFVAEWLELNGSETHPALEDQPKDPNLFPEMVDPDLREAMRQEVYALVDRVFFEGDAQLSSLFTSTEAYVTPALAALYGQPFSGGTPTVQTVELLPQAITWKGEGNSKVEGSTFLVGDHSYPDETKTARVGTRPLVAVTPGQVLEGRVAMAAGVTFRAEVRYYNASQTIVSTDTKASLVTGSSTLTSSVPVGATQAALRIYLSNVSDGSAYEILAASLSRKESSGPSMGAEGAKWIELSGGERAGLFTRAAFLTMYASDKAESPILRGVHLLKNVLCAPPGAPPPTANDTPVESQAIDGEALSIRELTDARTKGAECMVCHAQINKIGFALGNYDAIGQFQEKDSVTGEPVNASGELAGTDVDGEVDDGVDLSARLAGSAQVSGCVASHWIEQALGRRPSDLDGCSEEAVQGVFADTGDLRELLRSVVTSDAFLYRNEIAEEGDQ
ncbi:MAG: DUF1592 domain-containing protein, partial [Myxococcales bacterium]|nr:DUF1592 domain-containing protein [Myxococcales bacterium]